jgi:hypothetical protein
MKKWNRPGRIAKSRKTHSMLRSAVIEPLEARQLLSCTIEVRTTSGGTTATVSAVGQVVNLEVLAVVSGSTSGNNDGFQEVTGSLLGTETGTGGIVGDLSAQVTSDYTASGYQNGTQVDLNGDGGLDVGSNDNAYIAGFFYPRAGSIEQDGVVSGDTQTFEIGTLTYTVSQLNSGVATDINFRVRTVSGSSFEAVWEQDGDYVTDESASLLTGSPVVITDSAISAKGSIAGTVSQSVNGTVTPLSGATVYLDTNDSGSYVSGDPSAVTTSTGSYNISGLASGTYHLREVVPSGYTQTSPSSSPTNITLSSGQNVTGENFTDTYQTATISGTVTKVVSGVTSGFSGVTVYLDNDNSGTLTSGDTSVVTSSTGTYTISGLLAGTYHLREVVPTGYSQTSPSSSPTNITVTAGQNASGENFTDTAASTGATPLTGTVIGTAGSYGNDGNTIAKAFDGNLSTFFDGPSGSGDWAGLNLGQAYDITSIAFAPRSGFGSRMVGGSFQGSNISTFASGDVTLYTVSSAPTAGVLTTVSVSSTTAFQYVRYIGPANGYCNIAEIDFYGNLPTTVPHLTGTVIGTSGSYGNDGDTAANVFDGNLSTYFDAPSGSGDWAGLNLGSTYNLTSISFAPRSGFGSRMVGGTFQASSSATFASNVVNLYTVTTAPTAGVLTSVNVSVSGAYQYVRYIGPSNGYCNIAEAQFFGTPASGVTQLTGTVIGTSGSYENDGNTIAKVFDGSLSTFFDAATANGNWAGLNLGSAKSIAQISYAPRSGYASRMVGGVFQASNTADFSSGVVNLYTITAAPASGSYTTVSVNVTGTYQYVRYLSPNNSYGDVAEVVFYG